MVDYPVEVKAYFERNPSGSNKFQKITERANQAEKIQNYINEEMERREDEKSRIFLYGIIAADLKIDKHVIEALLQNIGGGANGITVVRRD